MNRRRKTSKGQALVLVTFALLAMCGVMGLVVDLGWSFYLKKAAQAAADAGALAAVQEAKIRMNGNFSGFICVAGGPVECKAGQAFCSSYGPTSTSNLNAACLYATTNGFADAGNQHVSVQANDSSTMPTTLTGTYSSKTLAYWVTVRVSQSVPQLFSTVLGNPTGIISASATAAVISAVVPGQFIALNQAGDCINGTNCGADFVLSGGSSVVAPGGVIISSACNGTGQKGCGGSSPTANGNGFATNTGGGVNTSQCVSTGTNCQSDGSPIMIQSPGVVDNTAHFVPGTTNVGASTATDPLLGDVQPPLASPSTPVGTCGIPSGSLNSAGQITGTSGKNAPLQLGPYQYYTYYQPTNGAFQMTGAPIQVSGNVQFSGSSTQCTAGGGTPGILMPGTSQSSNFPAFTFYGGLSLAGTKANVDFGAGQYVMVGAVSGGEAFTLGTNGGPTITGNTTTGTMFISTAPGYTSSCTSCAAGTTNALATQMTALAGNGASIATGLSQVNLLQGGMSFNGGTPASVQLSGISQSSSSLPTALDQYNGILIWQDRRNATSDYTTDASGNPVVYTPVTCASNPTTCNPNYMTNNLATATSPEFTFGSSPNFALSGTLYMPQGSWVNFQGSPKINSALQIITGAIQSGGGGTITLLPTTNQSIRYIAALIQ
jgi:Flp pilus assembly protein TadG